MANIVEKKWQLIDIDKLIPYENNAKKHDDAQVSKIAESIKMFGWRGSPIQVDKNMVIINGHGRRLAAIKLGMKQVPVTIESEMTEEEVKAYRLADNRVAMSDFDSLLLQQELETLIDFDMSGIFDKKELDFLGSNIMEMDITVFENNLDDVMAEQTNNTNEKIDNNSSKRIQLPKLLGFKDVSGADAVLVTRFIATLQAEFSQEPEQAFLSFIKKYLKE